MALTSACDAWFAYDPEAGRTGQGRVVVRAPGDGSAAAALRDIGMEYAGQIVDASLQRFNSVTPAR